MFGAWAELIDEQPPPAVAPVRPPEPTLDAGPHLSYAVQWFLFTAIGVAGIVVFIRGDLRARREEREDATEAHATV